MALPPHCQLGSVGLGGTARVLTGGYLLSVARTRRTGGVVQFSSVRAHERSRPSESTEKTADDEAVGSRASLERTNSVAPNVRQKDVLDVTPLRGSFGSQIKLKALDEEALRPV